MSDTLVAPKLYIDVSVYPGVDLPEAASQMVILAERLGISVWACMNGVTLAAQPGDNARDLLACWHRAHSNSLHERDASRDYSRLQANVEGAVGAAAPGAESNSSHTEAVGQ